MPPPSDVAERLSLTEDQLAGAKLTCQRRRPNEGEETVVLTPEELETAKLFIAGKRPKMAFLNPETGEPTIIPDQFWDLQGFSTPVEQIDAVHGAARREFTTQIDRLPDLTFAHSRCSTFVTLHDQGDGLIQLDAHQFEGYWVGSQMYFWEDNAWRRYATNGVGPGAAEQHFTGEMTRRGLEQYCENLYYAFSSWRDDELREYNDETDEYEFPDDMRDLEEFSPSFRQKFILTECRHADAHKLAKAHLIEWGVPEDYPSYSILPVSNQ